MLLGIYCLTTGTVTEVASATCFVSSVLLATATRVPRLQQSREGMIETGHRLETFRPALDRTSPPAPGGTLAGSLSIGGRSTFGDGPLLSAQEPGGPGGRRGAPVQEVFPTSCLIGGAFRVPLLRVMERVGK